MEAGLWSRAAVSRHSGDRMSGACSNSALDDLQLMQSIAEHCMWILQILLSNTSVRYFWVLAYPWMLGGLGDDAEICCILHCILLETEDRRRIGTAYSDIHYLYLDTPILQILR